MLLLEWLTSTTLTPRSPGEEGQQQELAFTAGGDAKAPENTVGQFLTELNKHRMMQPSQSLVFTQLSWKLCPHKNLYTNVYSSFIHNGQILKEIHNLTEIQQLTENEPMH